MVRPLSVFENAARSELMEKLYFLDQRDSPDHPHTGTFIGLWQEMQIRNKWNRLLGNR
tara:strand:+ start:147 stop:320 length:174 start_codon:yes stop_codon:yes gene_type:complete